MSFVCTEVAEDLHIEILALIFYCQNRRGYHGQGSDISSGCHKERGNYSSYLARCFFHSLVLVQP